MTTLRTITQDPRQWLALNIRWLRWPMILAVLLVVAVLASVVHGRNALFLLILLFAVPAILLGSYILLRWMAIGFLLLAPVNMLVPISIGTGSETSINATILLIVGMTGLWLFDMINNQRRVWAHRSRPILPLLLMLVATFISFLAGQLPWFSVAGSSLSAQIGGLAIFVICACAFLLAAHHIHSIRWLEWITWSFIIVGALFVVPGLFPPLLRLTGRFIQTGSYSSQFWTWFIIITFSQAWLNRKLHLGLRGILFALCAAALYIVLGREFEWKSGWIPPLVGIATIFALYSWKFLGAIGIAGLVALPVAISRLIATDEYSFGTRVDAWVILGEIIKTSPIVGLGPSNYYWYTPLFAIRGYSVKFNSHNQYVDLLAQIGIVGTFMVLWFFAEVAGVGWKLLRVVPEGFPKAYVYGALAGLVATVVSGMLGDWFLPFVYNVGMVGMRSSILCWVFLGALVAMEQMYLVKKVDSEQ